MDVGATNAAAVPVGPIHGAPRHSDGEARKGVNHGMIAGRHRGDAMVSPAV